MPVAGKYAMFPSYRARPGRAAPRYFCLGEAYFTLEWNGRNGADSGPSVRDTLGPLSVRLRRSRLDRCWTVLDLSRPSRSTV
jgi:hypothetical protein